MKIWFSEDYISPNQFMFMQLCLIHIKIIWFIFYYIIGTIRGSCYFEITVYYIFISLNYVLLFVFNTNKKDCYNNILLTLFIICCKNSAASYLSKH